MFVCLFFDYVCIQPYTDLIDDVDDEFVQLDLDDAQKQNKN
jgi:hypothetical protein